MGSSASDIHYAQWYYNTHYVLVVFQSQKKDIIYLSSKHRYLSKCRVIYHCGFASSAQSNWATQPFDTGDNIELICDVLGLVER
jgi:hypothetical protein